MKTLLTGLIWFTILVILAGGLNCRNGVMYVPQGDTQIPQHELEEAAERTNKCLNHVHGGHHDVLKGLKEIKEHKTHDFVCYATPVFGCFLIPGRVEFTRTIAKGRAARDLRASVLPHELLHLALFQKGDPFGDLGHGHPCFEWLRKDQMQYACMEHKEDLEKLNPTKVIKCRVQGDICSCSIEPAPCYKPKGECK